VNHRKMDDYEASQLEDALKEEHIPEIASK
jgi:hypothetical protein